MQNKELLQKIKDLYIKVDNKIMMIELSKKVTETPINLHYLRSLKQYKKIIMSLDSSNINLVNEVINKVNELLIVKEKNNSDSEEEENFMSDSDLEDSAAVVVEDKEGEKDE